MLNSGASLLSGYFCYTTVIVDREGVCQAYPLKADEVFYCSDQEFCLGWMGDANEVFVV